MWHRGYAGGGQSTWQHGRDTDWPCLTQLEIQLFLDHQSVSQSCSDYGSLHCYMIFEQNGCGNGLLKNAPQLLAFFIKTTQQSFYWILNTTLGQKQAEISYCSSHFKNHHEERREDHGMFLCSFTVINWRRTISDDKILKISINVTIELFVDSILIRQP